MGQVRTGGRAPALTRDERLLAGKLLCDGARLADGPHMRHAHIDELARLVVADLHTMGKRMHSQQ
jgi:hypothetical protein